MSRPTVAILGASADRRKFGNKSVRAHLRGGYDVYPVNPRADEIEGLRVYRSLADVPVEQLDRISVYLSPEVGLNLLPEIAGKGAREVWFNPGSESPELLGKARALRLNVVTACSIVDVGMRPDELPDS
jgi:predicted CoA-binding protein